MRSWRTASVALLSFSSGLPLGVVWYSIPDWMRDIGVDIRVVGLLTLAQAPWAFKVILALFYLPMLVLTWKSPEPEEVVAAPKTLREAVWHPFIGFLSRHRALEILAFVLLYKLTDQLTTALTRPFLIDMGYSADHR